MKIGGKYSSANGINVLGSVGGMDFGARVNYHPNSMCERVWEIVRDFSLWE